MSVFQTSGVVGYNSDVNDSGFASITLAAVSWLKNFMYPNAGYPRSFSVTVLISSMSNGPGGK